MELVTQQPREESKRVKALPKHKMELERRFYKDLQKLEEQEKSL